MLLLAGFFLLPMSKKVLFVVFYQYVFEVTRKAVTVWIALSLKTKNEDDIPEGVQIPSSDALAHWVPEIHFLEATLKANCQNIFFLNYVFSLPFAEHFTECFAEFFTEYFAKYFAEHFAEYFSQHLVFSLPLT